MPKIKVNDTNIYYETHGQGQPIVFISGFTADHSRWACVRNDFSENYQVITFDNRGTGQSDHHSYPYTIDIMTNDTIELCKALKIDSAHFIGNSMGGAIAQTIAYKYPEFVKSTILCNTSMKFNIKVRLASEANLTLRQAKAPLEAILKRTLFDIFSVDFLSKEDLANSLLEMLTINPNPITDQGYSSQMHALFEFDSHNWINNINKPCLVIYSDEDALVDLASSEALIAAIPKTESFCFHKVGHAPDIEQPKLFIKIVNEFIKKLG
jgi:3-oxoadipate enol-lactonase